MVTCQYIDIRFKEFGLQQIDGEIPSPLTGVTFSAADGNLRQHGKQFSMHMVSP